MSDSPIACRGVFFDLYGTLLRYGSMDQAWQDWLAGMHEGLLRHGHAREPELLATTFAGFLNRPEPPLELPGRTLFERRVARELGTLGVTLAPADLAALCDDCVGRWQAHVTLDPESLPLLGVLRDTHTLALISNFDHEIHVHDVLRASGLAAYFETIVVSAEVGFAKPDPRVFDTALGATGLEARDIVYVGDADIDRDAARRAGMSFVRVDRAGAVGDDGCPCVRSLPELTALLGTRPR